MRGAIVARAVAEKVRGLILSEEDEEGFEDERVFVEMFKCLGGKRNLYGGD